jgi:hypothetical protein
MGVVACGEGGSKRDLHPYHAPQPTAFTSERSTAPAVIYPASCGEPRMIKPTRACSRACRRSTTRRILGNYNLNLPRDLDTTGHTAVFSPNFNEQASSSKSKASPFPSSTSTLPPVETPGYDEDFYGMLIKKICKRNQQGTTETSTTTSICILLEWTSSPKRQISANTKFTMTQPVQSIAKEINADVPGFSFIRYKISF